MEGRSLIWFADLLNLTAGLDGRALKVIGCTQKQFSQENRVLNEVLRKKKHIFVPLWLGGRHFVGVCITPQSSMIRYYDPATGYGRKGKSVGGRVNQLLSKQWKNELGKDLKDPVRKRLEPFCKELLKFEEMNLPSFPERWKFEVINEFLQ